MPVMLQRQPRDGGESVGGGAAGLGGFAAPAGLAPAQRRALCAATQLLLLSQKGVAEGEAALQLAGSAPG